MNWTVEGKIGEWKVECDPNGNLQSIEFEIKATNEYQIKTKDKNYNCFVEAQSSNALLLEQDKRLNANVAFLTVFASCKDNSLRFAFEGTADTITSLKSITVK